MAAISEPIGTRLLPVVLSMIAGSADTISFIGLGGLFTAHVTGNLVMIAAHIVAGGAAPPAHLLSVPVFIAVVGLARLLASRLEQIGAATLRPLLLLQSALLCAFLAACLAAGTPLDPDTPAAVLGAMLGVAAMAVQNALVQVSLNGTPSTAVMTTNITRFTVDLGEVLLARDRDSTAAARGRARRTWPTILGFTAGCALGAACQSAGLVSLALPAGLSLLAVALGSDGAARGPSARRDAAGLPAPRR